MASYGGPLLQDFFLQRVKSDPDLIAISWLGETEKDALDLTFRQLENLACLLAHELVHLDQRVIPLCLPKSIEMLVSMLAVILAGKAYCCLEPAWPLDRRKDIVEEVAGCQATVLGDDCGGFVRIDPNRILRSTLERLRKGKAMLNEGKPSNCLPRPSPEDAAYIIYTSGSTGKPKGITISHSNVVAFLSNYRDVFGRVRADDPAGCRVLQFASYAFDVSVMSIWDTWAHGATVCLTTSDRMRTDLAQVVQDLRITHVDLTPTVSQLLLEAFDDPPTSLEELSSWRERTGCHIRQHGTGSEPVPKRFAQEWLRRGVTLVNDYGPSETCVGVSSLRISPKDSNWLDQLSSSYLPIGRPNGSNQIYLLSPASVKEIAEDEVGEICIGGPQVSLEGYVRSELNADVFIEHAKFGRLYRTGDLGRWLRMPDCEPMLECLGRIDTQVKINGIRIELAEIEQHVKHTRVASSAVEVTEHRSGTSVIVAFLVLKGESDDAESKVLRPSPAFERIVNELRHHIAAALPEPMIPKRWLPLNKLPVQSSGKTDRKRLRELALASSDALHSTEGDRSGTWTSFAAQTMRRAWSRILRIDEECLTDVDEWNKSGGDSIGFIRLVGQLRKAGYRDASFALLADAANLGEACRLLETLNPGQEQLFTYAPFSLLDISIDETAQVAKILPDQIEDAWPVTPTQETLLAPSLDLKDDLYYAQAVYAVDTAVVDAHSLKRAIDKLVEGCQMLHSIFVMLPETGTMVQIVLKGTSAQISSCWLRELKANETFETAIDAIRREHKSQLSLRSGRVPVAFTILVGADGITKLCWSMHHALSDGWTLDLLHEDLAAICAGSSATARPSFGGIARSWIQRQSSSPVESHWRGYLKAARTPAWPKTLSDLPITRKASMRHWQGDLVRQLQKCGITPAIATRVAIYLALLLQSRCDDLIVGIVRSGRDIELEGAEDIIGPCISVLPARCGVVRQPKATVLDILRAEVESDRQARQHQHISLSQLNALVHSSAGGTRLCTTLITYQSAAERDPHMRLPVSEPPESIVMPTVYALSIEITPTGHGFTLAAYYDDRCLSDGEVDSLLTKACQSLDFLWTHLEEPLNGFLPPSRARLPSMPRQSVPAKRKDAPQEMVRVVTDLWSKVLCVDRGTLDADSHWTHVSGNSILAMRLTALLKRQGLHLPTSQLAVLPTIGHQAAYLAHSGL